MHIWFITSLWQIPHEQFILGVFIDFSPKFLYLQPCQGYNWLMSVIWHACWQIFHLHQLENKRTIKACVSTSIVGNLSFSTEWSHHFGVLGESSVSFCAAHSVNQMASFQSSSAPTLLPSAALTNQPNNTWLQVGLSATMMSLHTDQRNHVYTSQRSSIPPQSALKVQKSLKVPNVFEPSTGEAKASESLWV